MISMVHKLLLLVCVLSVSGLRGSIAPRCPDLCTKCVQTRMVCNVTGLSRIDANIPSSIQVLEYSNQYSFNDTLSSANFSHFERRFHITSLTLKRTSIGNLQSRAFQHLKYLKNLDLSFHGLLKTNSETFYGLDIVTLNLNNIGRLMMSNASFVGSKVRKLYMENSHLTMLHYKMFEPIKQYLKELYLKHNQIRRIDRKFEPLFDNLRVIELKENPLVCYCDMLWLNKLLKQKQRLDVRYSHDSPRCVAPTNLRKRLLHKIDEFEFNCYIPKISQIDIDILTDNLAKMTCKINPTPLNYNTPVNVYWSDPGQPSNPIRTSDNNQQFAIYHISNYQNGYNKNLKCVAKNLVGNNSVVVYISWLKSEDSPKSAPKKTNKSVSNYYPNSNKNKNIHKPDLSVINADINASSYLFQKQYTLLEMTSAVIGTFIITVLFFIIFYKFYTNRHYGYKSGKKSLNYTLHTEPPTTNNNIDIQNAYNSHSNMDSAMITPNYSINSNTKFFPFNTISILPNNQNHNNNNNNNNHNNQQNQHNTISKNHCNTLGFNLDEVSSHYSNNSQTYDSINNHPPIIANPNNINTNPHTNNLSHNNPSNNNPNSPGYLSNLTNSPSAHFIDYKTHRNLYHPGNTTAQIFNNNIN